MFKHDEEVTTNDLTFSLPLLDELRIVTSFASEMMLLFRVKMQGLHELDNYVIGDQHTCTGGVKLQFLDEYCSHILFFNRGSSMDEIQYRYRYRGTVDPLFTFQCVSFAAKMVLIYFEEDTE